MKKAIAMTLGAISNALAVHAQGTVNFQNIGPGLNAPVVLMDGVTKADGGYTAELLAGPTASSLTAIATTPMLTGAAAGYFLGGVQTIQTVAGGGTADILVEVWNSASYSSFAAAQVSGLLTAWTWSNGGVPFTVVTGNPTTTPPGLPAVLYGLNVPEPSALALAGLAFTAVLILRRRHAP